MEYTNSVIKIKGLLSHAQVAIEGISPIGVNTIWSLNGDYGTIINDILLVDDIQWAVQSRSVNVSISWDTIVFEKVLNFRKGVSNMMFRSRYSSG